MITTRNGLNGIVEGASIRRSVLDSFERLLWWLFAESAGAKTRKIVLSSIRDKPRNAQQLSRDLGLDYTTVRHHLRVLEANNLVVAEGAKYGRVYFVSETMESRWDRLATIDGSLRRSRGRSGR